MSLALPRASAYDAPDQKLHPPALIKARRTDPSAEVPRLLHDTCVVIGYLALPR